MIYFFLPETAGLSLEALDSIFDHTGITRGVLDKTHRKQMLLFSASTQIAISHQDLKVCNTREHEQVAEVNADWRGPLVECME